MAGPGASAVSRGRWGRLLQAFPDYASIAWWGLLSPRRESGPLRVCQAVVLGDAGVLLTVRADLRGWELPGGHANPGEGDEATAVREVLEETGLEIAIEGRVGDYVRSGFRPHTAHVFRARVTGGALRPSPETPRVAWFDPAKLPTTIFPWFRSPLEDALAGASDLERHEHQSLASIAAGMRIDLRMRWSNDQAR